MLFLVGIKLNIFRGLTLERLLLFPGHCYHVITSLYKFLHVSFLPSIKADSMVDKPHNFDAHWFVKYYRDGLWYVFCFDCPTNYTWLLGRHNLHDSTM